VINTSWWRGRRVFLTGHTGFKGAWLTILLRHLGAEIHGYSLPAPTNPSLFELGRLSEIAPTTEADVRDLSKLASALKTFNPQIVIHMAAQSLVRESYFDPVGTYETNVLGTVNLLDSVRQTPGVRAVVVVTTDKCYENNEWIWPYREDDRLGGRDPYSNSKACAELVTSAFRDSYFSNASTAIASARAGNVIGGGDWAKDRLIPDMVRAFSEKRPVMIRHPDAIRPWQFVLEPLCGYLMLAEKLVEQGQGFAEAWNFGPSDDDSKPVRWIADRLARGWGAGVSWESPLGEYPHEAASLKLDASKARARLDWHPLTTLPETLDSIVAWYQAQRGGENVRQLCERQIEHYLSRVSES
jgi:CDP-glucose 4,6-dehydratase